MSNHPPLRRYHAPVWDEPLAMEMSVAGRRGQHYPIVDADDLVPAAMRRQAPPELPEISEPDVLRHYLRLSQQTMGMMGISLFGTCTMKYNPRLHEKLAAGPHVAEMHPEQHPDTMQGLLECVWRLEDALKALSGMARFSFQPAGGADAAYTQACITRAYHAAHGDADRRTQIVTSIQSHPCNPATAAAAGFDIVTLPLESNGYPSIQALRAALSDRTAALFINNPDDMGVYNPEIRDWVDAVHAAGGLCFYDHANFNGVMGKIRAADLGFDACMFMLHKTFGVPKGGGGPAVGAYGCTEKLAPFLPGPLVAKDGNGFAVEPGAASSIGRVREYWGNIHQVMKAYGWVAAMGAEGIAEASDISVALNNYMEKKLLAIRGVTRSHPDQPGWRLEMTRYSLGQLYEETGVGGGDVQNRMADFGIDAFWMAHEPWIFPHPFTPEAGEMWSREDIDYWIAVLAHVCDEAYRDPDMVKSAPHNQAVGKLAGDDLDDPAVWATTWAAWQRKHGG
ncbi:aminomethyl-transferring glycine dehydrogenase subunit GcvPB [Sphingomonas baiyangensis]|uniref:Aminotransferase class V-fold PLP-dependent enzyme n=1 Tax=Sphingomonas baiyangensis TaxID=2572576 RepID=A0A4U1L1V4_9SPHN|nr:aminomethyl-transferring glycine dehydrogenase subunit GcvPB [Sphingomonas baiyangensis]TKD49976.1 aminotransferase class V-fold PLP-dependent enzyme [Sphingomonas baiyangensis]